MTTSAIRTLTVRQRATVAAVEAHYAAHGRPPSYKELAFALGVRKSQADRLVKLCVTLGSLKVIRRKGVRTEIGLCSPLATIATADLVAEVARRLATPPPAPGKRAGNPDHDTPAALAA